MHQFEIELLKFIIKLKKQNIQIKKAALAACRILKRITPSSESDDISPPGWDVEHQKEAGSDYAWQTDQSGWCL